jgi:hypothetical protein
VRRWFLLCLLIPSFSFSNNLTGFWASNGGDKIPRDWFYPHGATSSTTTISRTWDGTNVNIFSAQNQTVGFEVIAINNSGVDASSVTVVMSSMTCSDGQGMVSVAVSSFNVTDTTTRPIQTFSAWYVQNKGGSVFPFGFGEYEERQYPVDMRIPCTVNLGNNQCSVDQSLKLWSSRRLGDLYLPIAWVPEEEYLISSETVKTGTSKSFYTDIWVSTRTTNLTVNCSGYFNVYEGPTLSTALPVNLKIYNVKLPASPSFQDTAWIDEPDIDLKLNGTRFPGTPTTGNYLTGRNNAFKLLKAHNIVGVGDAPDSAANDFPSAEYESHYSTNSTDASGLLYTSVNGYGNARGVGVPDKIYGIGIYGAWVGANWSTTVTGGANGFCTNVSSWTAYCQNRGIQCFMYTPDDEGSPTQMAGLVNTLTTWLSTAPACAYNGHRLAFMQTQDLPVLTASAPYTSFPTSAQLYDDLSAGTNIWQIQASSIMAGNGPSGSLGQVWVYNSGSQGWGAIYDYAEEGYVPEADYWAMWKKLCYDGTCHGGHFFYAADGWQASSGNPNNANSDLYNDPMTFGYRNYFVAFTVSGITNSPTCDYTDSNANQYDYQPSTLTTSGTLYTFNIANNINTQTMGTPSAGGGTLSIVAGQCGGQACTCGGDATVSYSSWVVTARRPNSQWGDHSGTYSQGDGTFFYPGRDSVFTNPSFGFNGVVAGFVLKNIRDGITDIDILNAAYKVNPSSTTVIVQAMFPQALWEFPCYENTIGGDCSYAYGDRSWAYTADAWVKARELLLEIASQPALLAVSVNGNCKITGNVQFR